MDFSDILNNLDKAIGIIGILAGFGGVVANYLLKAKVKDILTGAREVVDLVDYYEKADADHVWTPDEDREFGQKARTVVQRLKPLVRKLIKK